MQTLRADVRVLPAPLTPVVHGAVTGVSCITLSGAVHLVWLNRHRQAWYWWWAEHRPLWDGLLVSLYCRKTTFQSACQYTGDKQNVQVQGHNTQARSDTLLISVSNLPLSQPSWCYIAYSLDYYTLCPPINRPYSNFNEPVPLRHQEMGPTTCTNPIKTLFDEFTCLLPSQHFSFLVVVCIIIIYRTQFF